MQHFPSMSQTLWLRAGKSVRNGCTHEAPLSSCVWQHSHHFWSQQLCQQRCHLCHLWQPWWDHCHEGTWSPSVNSGALCDPSHWQDGAGTLDLLTMFMSWWAPPGRALLQHFCTMSDGRPLPQLSQCYTEANSSAWQAVDFQLEI